MFRVVKLGGSLLAWSEWPARLTEWLRGQTPARNVIIAGGGELVDAIHRLHSIFRLDDETAHWLCVRAMSITAEVASVAISKAMPESQLVVNWNALTELRDRATVVFDVESFLREIEASLPGERLPHSWDATSDSIAARAATCLGAGELVLLKSVDPLFVTHDELAAAGYVDRHFPRAAAGVPSVRFVNLRG